MTALDEQNEFEPYKKAFTAIDVPSYIIALADADNEPREYIASSCVPKDPVLGPIL